MKRLSLSLWIGVCACAACWAACGPEAWGVDGAGGVSATFGGQTFRVASAAPATVKAVSKDRVELELSTDGGPVRAVWARDGEGALTLALSAPADQPMPKALAYPAGWETRAGDDLVLPFGEGVAYPVTDGGVQFRRARFAFSNGMGVSMGRLRGDSLFDWRFVGLSHNTLRGAAGGAVLIAELLCAQGYIPKK